MLLPAALVAVLHYASFDILLRPIVTDISFYLYFAQRVAAGAVPYVDFFEHKTPLAIFAGAIFHALGTALGLDPLLAIRAGYLALAALAALVLFLLYARIFNNRPAAGWIGMTLSFAFPLLGLMPAIGNIPKLLTVLGAGAALLAAHRRRWIFAGIFAALAALDWQPGGLLAILGVLAAASLRPARARSLLRALLGMALAAAPILLWFAAHGALRAFFELTIGASLADKSAALPFPDRWRMILDYIRLDCSGALWLAWLAPLGMFTFAARTLCLLRRPRGPLMIGLSLYHYGIIAFSLLDFGGHGDMFILNHSLAFFAALPAAELYYWILRILTEKVRRRPRGDRFVRHSSTHLPSLLLRGVVAVLLVALVRPAFLTRGDHAARLTWAADGYSLADQRRAADILCRGLGARRIAAAHQQELLFLGGATSAAPFLFWNWATIAYYRQDDENSAMTLTRLWRDADPDAVLLHPAMLTGGQLMRTPLGPWLAQEYRPMIILPERDARYAPLVWLRRGTPIPEDLPLRLLQLESPGAPQPQPTH